MSAVALQEPDMATLNFDAALVACRAHLADPGTVFTMYTVVQVWGRTKP